jgi:LacI family transcriptional regulator
MRLLAPPPALYVSVQTYGNAYHSNERVRSFHDALQSVSGISLVHEQCKTIEDHREVASMIERIITTHGEPAGYYVANDAVCHVAQVASNLVPPSRKPVFIGFDLIGENKTLLKSGVIDCLISQHPEYQGYEAVMRLFRSVVLRIPEREAPLVPIDILFKENLRG